MFNSVKSAMAAIKLFFCMNFTRQGREELAFCKLKNAELLAAMSADAVNKLRSSKEKFVEICADFSKRGASQEFLKEIDAMVDVISDKLKSYEKADSFRQFSVDSMRLAAYLNKIERSDFLDAESFKTLNVIFKKAAEEVKKDIESGRHNHKFTH